MILVSHPTGNANVRAVVQGLVRCKRRFLFHTTIAFAEKDRRLTFLPQSVRSEFLRRSYAIPPDSLATRPLRETCRLLGNRFGLSRLTNDKTGWASIDAVYYDLDSHVATQHLLKNAGNGINAVYSYEDGALETFRAAKQLGIPCCYDLPIAYWETSRRLIQEERERLPEWEVTLGRSQDADAKFDRKREELELADAVICPSEFVYESLPLHARGSKLCCIANFGSPPARKEKSLRRRSAREKLRVLFAGSLSQRKGLADVFSAMKMIGAKNAELILLGSPIAPLSFYRQQYADFKYEAPRPHESVLQLMESCDVLVLPSIVEGRALVQQEAMSCGLPIIVTPNAGGEDLIVEGETGFLIPIRSPEILAEKLAWCAGNLDRVQQMGKASQTKASTYTWTRYGDTILQAIDQLLLKPAQPETVSAGR